MDVISPHKKFVVEVLGLKIGVVSPYSPLSPGAVELMRGSTIKTSDDDQHPLDVEDGTAWELMYGIGVDFLLFPPLDKVCNWWNKVIILHTVHCPP